MFSAIRYVTRGLMKAAGAVLTLSIGIGLAISVYVLARAALDPGPDLPDSARLARLYAASPAFGVIVLLLGFAITQTFFVRANVRSTLLPGVC